MPKDKILLLGSGELGKEVVISAKRLGKHVVAVDSYANAPAMQVADEFEVINMLDSEALEKVVARHQPHIIIPEIEAIRTEKLQEFEDRGVQVVPTARATYLTMNRIAIRELASKELNMRTAKYAYAETEAEHKAAVDEIGLPCVVKPIMSSSGKGQSIVRTRDEIQKSWDYAVENMRGTEAKVIVEEFVQFDLEITLLTIKQKAGETIFVKPIGHRQVSGDYRESWLPASMPTDKIVQAEEMAKKVTNALGGAGLFGVEFFITKDEVVFNELSPRPHDTGMVTLISQDLSEFDLHMRAVLGLPIPEIQYKKQIAASAVILADMHSDKIRYSGLDKALEEPATEVRIFRKPTSRPNRRMGVALALGQQESEARQRAQKAAESISLHYDEELKS